MTEGLELESKQGKEFSLLHSVKTGPETQPVSYPMTTEDLSSEIKRPEREAGHSLSTSAEVEKMCTPPYVFMILHYLNTGIILHYFFTLLAVITSTKSSLNVL
jgi:hypothetical protein